MLAPLIVRRKTNYTTNLIGFLLKDDHYLPITKKQNAMLAIEMISSEIRNYIRENTIVDHDIKSLSHDLKKGKKIKYTVNDRFINSKIQEFNQKVQLVIDLTNKIVSDQQSKITEERMALQNVYRNNQNLSESIKFTIGGSVQEKLTKYLLQESNLHNKKLRKIDRLLVTYLLRATVKTSPLADLVVSEVTGLDNLQNELLCNITINHSFLMELFSKVIDRNEAVLDCTYVLNKTMIKKANKIFVTVPKSSTDQINHSYLINNRQGLSSIVVNKQIEKLFEMVKGEVSYNELIKQAESIYQNTELAQKLVQRLITADFFVRQELFDDSEMDYFEQIIHYIATHKIENWLCLQLQKINEMIHYLEGVQNINTQQMAELEVLLEEIRVNYELKAIPAKNLVYLDYSKGTNFEVDFHPFDPLIECLQYLALMFDSAFRSRIFVSHQLLQNNEKLPEINNNVERSALFRRLGKLLEETNQPAIYTGEYDFSKDEASELINQMNYFVIHLFTQIEQMSDSEATFNVDQLNQEMNFIKVLTEAETLSHTFFFQEVDEQSLVVNHIYKGFTTFISRFTKAYGKQAEYQQYVTQKMKNVITFPYSYGFNANLHQNYFEDNISLPYDFSLKTSYTWENISVEIGANQLLEFKAEGKRVFPNFTGSLVKMACPPIQNIFDILSVNGSVFLDFSDMYLNYQLMNTATQKSIIVCPRVTIVAEEQSIVLARKKLLVETAIFLPYSKELTKLHEKLVSVLNSNGFAHDFYIRIFSNELNLKQANNLKPQYINSDSLLLLKLFKHIIEKDKYITIEETLPSPKVYVEKICEEYVIESTI